MKKILALFSFLFGTFLLINSENTITGAFVGSNLAPSLTSSIGIFFIFVSGLLFFFGVEDKVKKKENL